MVRTAMLLLLGLSAALAGSPSADRLPDGRDGTYAALVAAIEVDRRALAARGDLAAARAYLRDAVTGHPT